METVEKSNVDVLLEAVRNLQESSDNAINDIPKLKKDLKEIENEMCDVDHFIEFGEFSASDGYLLAKELQRLRRERRKLKDELSILEELSEMILSKKRIIKDMQRIGDKIDNHENFKATRKYKPRIRAELFNKLKNKEVYIVE